MKNVNTNVNKKRSRQIKRNKQNAYDTTDDSKEKELTTTSNFYLDIINSNVSLIVYNPESSYGFKHQLKINKKVTNYTLSRASGWI